MHIPMRCIPRELCLDMRMTPNQMNILARLVEELRPEWNFPGIRAAIGTVAEDRSRYDICHAMLTAAADPTAQTPATIRNPAYWPSAAPTTTTRIPARFVDDDPEDVVDDNTRAAFLAKIRAELAR